MKLCAAIDFACNDPDNGIFAGRAGMAMYGDVELESPDIYGGYRFAENPDSIRIHRRTFRIEGSRDWVGNWCWNRYYLPRQELKRLLITLRAHGWRVVCGPSRFRDWWNRGMAS